MIHVIPKDKRRIAVCILHKMYSKLEQEEQISNDIIILGKAYFYHFKHNSVSLSITERPLIVSAIRVHLMFLNLFLLKYEFALKGNKHGTSRWKRFLSF